VLRIGLVFNTYYKDAGQTYIKQRLTQCFLKNAAVCVPFNAYTSYGLTPSLPPLDAVVFWDKDVYAAMHLERLGLKVFNNAQAIAVCDDKAKTYEVLAQLKNIALIPTILAPLCYENSLQDVDEALLDKLEHSLGHPLIVKHNTGSLGGQVYLAKDRAELTKLYLKLKTLPHQYQKFVGKSGSDTRVYTIGGKAIAVLERHNPDSFIANVAGGGMATLVKNPQPQLIDLAETIAKKLNLDYAAIDFLYDCDTGMYFFLEANASAYFKAVESLGVSIAEPFVEYICKKI